jgi:hypothetical protein
MKKLVILVVLAAVVFASCNVLMPVGKTGKTYISFDRDDTVSMKDYYGYGPYTFPVKTAYLDLPEFPTSIYHDTDYEITPGSYTGTALLYAWDSYYGFSYYKYAGVSYKLTGDAYSWTSKSTRYTEFTYSVKANPGKQGFLTPGADGADKYYSIYLTWDPANWAVTSKGLVAMSSKVLSSSASKIVKEFSDDANTITLEINLGNGSPAPSGAEMIMEPGK